MKTTTIDSLCSYGAILIFAPLEMGLAQSSEKIADLDVRGYPTECRLNSQPVACGKIKEALTATGCNSSCNVHLHVAASSTFAQIETVLLSLGHHKKIGFVNDDALVR
jgi:hypothetical protein